MPTWMLLEDETAICNMILAMCDLLGVGGVAFKLGEDALEWIAEVDNGLYHRELPELALLDIRIPGLVDGVMIAERLRKSKRLRNIAVVMMTANLLTAQEEQAILTKSGADYLLHKPLPPLRELDELLRELVRQAKKSGDSPAQV
jgi:CheY-like chemotaxis protein